MLYLSDTVKLTLQENTKKRDIYLKKYYIKLGNNANMIHQGINLTMMVIYIIKNRSFVVQQIRNINLQLTKD